MRATLRLILPVAAALAIAACGSATPASTPAPSATQTGPGYTYPLLYETSFATQCENAGASYQRCSCALRAIEHAVPYSTAIAATHQIVTGNPPDWYLSAARGCR